MIITRILSGLGNQMFQYAAGLAVAQRHRTVLLLDVNWFQHHPEYGAHNRYGLSCFNITEQFATQREIDRLRGLPLSFTERVALRAARLLHLVNFADRHTAFGRYHSQHEPGRYPAFESVPDHSYIEGMWQSESFFEEVAPLVRLHFSFRYPMSPAVATMADRIRDAATSVAMHFRRGDYVSDPRFAREIGAVDVDYYHRAEAHIRERFPNATLFIFSDDIAAVRREFTPAGPHLFVEAVGPWNAFDEMRLISLCDHAVISNSTFAWWGAWLNQSKQKLVIAPDPWFADRRPENDHIVPKRWLRLPRLRMPEQTPSLFSILTLIPVL